MAIAHLCMGCGTDLARVPARRAIPDALPIAICPKCDRGAVRQRHPISATWRKARRLGWTLFILFVQLVMLSATVGMFFGGGLYTVHELLPRISPAFMASHKMELIFIYLIGPIVTGMWLTAGFPHLRRWRVWLGFAVVIIGVWILGTVMAVLFEYDIEVRHNLAPRDFITFVRETLPRDGVAARWLFTLLYLPWQLVVAIAGIPLGIGVTLGWRVCRRGLVRAKGRSRRRSLAS